MSKASRVLFCEEGGAVSKRSHYWGARQKARFLDYGSPQNPLLEPKIARLLSDLDGDLGVAPYGWLELHHTIL